MLNILNSPEEVLQVLQNAENQKQKTGKCFLDDKEIRSLKRRLSRLLKEENNIVKNVDNSNDEKK